MNEASDRPSEPHVITLWRFLHAQVCSTGTWDEALDFIRERMPAGTSGNWFKADEEPHHAPVACEKYPERTHYMFIC